MTHVRHISLTRGIHWTNRKGAVPRYLEYRTCNIPSRGMEGLRFASRGLVRVSHDQWEKSTLKPFIAATILGGVLATAVVVSPVLAQSPDQHGLGSDETPSLADLSEKLSQVQGKVAELEAALGRQHRATYGTEAPLPQPMTQSMNKMGGMGMGEMGGMKSMSSDSNSQMSDMKMGMGMAGKGMGMMSMMKGKKGMMGMGMMGMNPAMASDSMAGMEMPSALPGFPGASHLYHIGETGFFLDHPEHIELTDEQQKQLNMLKEASLLATSTAERRIEEAEQELWKLTASDVPDINKIESKATEIAQLQVENRIAFIRSVGEAASLLTKEQRQSLVGESKE